MAPPHFHDIHEIAIAAALRPIRRRRQAGCGKLARLVERHLRWLEIRAASPHHAAASLVCCRMRAVSLSTPCNYATF